MFAGISVYPGVVEALTSGTDPGPASQMVYRVRVNLPGGPRSIDGLRCVRQRWPDTLDCRALRPGEYVSVASVHGALALDAREIPVFAPCAEAGDGTLDDPERIIRAVEAMSPAQRQRLAQLLAAPSDISTGDHT